MAEKFIFTVATGRCGQASLTALVNRHVPTAYGAFEEPRIAPMLPGVLGDMERRFRRRFVETDELLGRGKVLDAFVTGDDDYIERVVGRRLSQIRRALTLDRKSVYFDISKFFARGLHVGYTRKLPAFALVLLVRDPVKNMRSFLNRNKNFYKDNSSPDAARNQLRLDPARLDKGELYLWAWCELYLRYLALRESAQVTHATEIRTDDLLDTGKVGTHFKALGLDFIPIRPVPALNTNVEHGQQPTIVTADDISTFERFYEKLPASIVDQIGYFKSYRPRAAA